MNRSLRIAILEDDPNSRSATGVRGRAMREHLISRGHLVEVLGPPPGALEAFQRSRFSLRSRFGRRLQRRPTLPHLWDHLADLLRTPLLRGEYDVAIARSQAIGYVLLCDRLRCRRILDLANVAFLEQYYAPGSNTAEVNETFEKEEALLKVVDHILLPNDLLGEVMLEHWQGAEWLTPKLATVPLGASPAERVARYAESPQIVYAGSYYYIQDPYLLAQLSRDSPWAIHCYGPSNPNRTFLPGKLEYRGYAASESFLAEYQFGLITVSRDRLRQFSPATKLPYYFAHGLPVLFPEWMREGHRYPDAAIPYAEETFRSVVEAAQTRERWEGLHAAALSYAQELTWERCFEPLGRLLGR